MAKYKVATNKVRGAVGDLLPDSFETWCSHLAIATNGQWGWFSVKTASLKGLVPDSLQQALVPFIELPDGSAIAVWRYEATKSPIVYVSHDGILTVIARTWAEFLKRWSLGKTGVPDMDDRESSDAPNIHPQAKLGSNESLTKKLRSIAKESNKPRDKPSSTTAQKLGDFLYAYAKKKRLLKRDVDSVDLIVTLTSRTYKVQWYDGGLKDFPWPNELQSELQEWTDSLGRPLKKSELSIWRDGDVFFEKNVYLRRAE